MKNGKLKLNKMFHMKHYLRYQSSMELFSAKAYSHIHAVPFTDKGKYYKDIITFDIETTTIDKENSFMYIWMISINGHVYYHYNWQVFVDFIDFLKEHSREFVIWVHNLAFEFAFIQQLFEWEKVFSTSPHKVIFCETGNVLFRCTYFMTNLSLAKIPKVFELPVKKLVGDLDYKKVRLPHVTPLTEREKCYCENDVLILHHYIAKMIDLYGDFSPSKLPYTATGFTRKHLQDCAKKDKQYGSMRTIVKESSVVDLTVYHMFQRAFAGGYAHLNYVFNNLSFTPENTPKGIRSRDKKSFYPSLMVKKKYPRTFFKAKPEKVFQLIKLDYAIIMDVCFFGLKAKTSMTTISEHKCAYIKNADIDNGRLFSADIVVTTITEQDLEIIQLYYDIDSFKIGRCYASKKRYLPKTLVNAVLDLYEAKTTLKDVKGVEQEYQRLKALLNSLYGCCVTDIIQPLIHYNPETLEFINMKLTKEDEAEMLREYRNNFKSLLLYQTGVYVTAYARNEILKEDWLIGEDRVVYNDTDSTKYLWDEETEKIFDEANRKNLEEMRIAMEYHKIDFSRTHPKDIKGHEHQLGEMGVEETYPYFKSLGAKRYVYISDEDKTIHCTIAGLPKKSAQFYFCSGLPDKREGAPTFEEMLDKFTNQMYIPPEISGKNTHYYTLPQGVKEFTDYLGNTSKVYVGTGISLVPQCFEMNLSASYKNFIATHTEITGFSHSERFSSIKNLTKIKTYWEDF